MRSWFANRSIRLKVTLCLLALALALLLSSSIIFFIKDLRGARANLQHTLSTIGTLLAVENVATLEFDDSHVATETLSNLKAFPSIVSAWISRKDGTLFATYPGVDAESPAPPWQLSNFSGNEDRTQSLEKIDFMYINIPILSKEGAIIGSIHLMDDQREINATINDHILLSLYITAGLLLLSLFTSMYLGRMIAGPILRLSKGVADVTRNRDFSSRIKQERGDEVGQLVADFNRMLGQLESRDTLLQEHQRSLEDKVRERTAQIEEEKHRAELANLAKSQFLASMSHEIRTPMNGILGMANLLSRTKMSPRQMDFLETIHESGESLLVLISDILDLSKIESGKIEIEDVAFDPAVLVEQTMGMFAAMARKKRIELVTAISPQLPAELIGDMQRIRQVLTNLVGNALKFTEEGQIRVHCHAHILEDECHLHLDIEDTGIGIREKALDTIFESFIQGDGSTTRKYGGTGLGLSISRQLMEAMGGDLSVKSVTGMGSVFSMSLITQLSHAEFVYAEKDLAGLHIGIIMDSQINRMSIQDHLVHWGAAVHGFSSSKEALSHLSIPQNLAPFDIILVNRKMAFMDGAEFTSTLRELRSNLPPILLLTCIQECDQLDNLHLFDDFIFKPLRRQQLHSTLLTTLGRKKRKEDGSTPFASGSAQRSLLRGSNLQLLIAEDSKINRDVLLGMLEDLGLSIEVATNGIEAIDLYREKKFDFIFMDCQMPLMDGYETSHQIRLLEKDGSTRTPIVALTANALSGDRQRALDSGMDDYLTKPFRQEQLISTIYHWTLDSGAHAPQTTSSHTPEANKPIASIDISILKDYQGISEQNANDLLQLVVSGFLEESKTYIADLQLAFHHKSTAEILTVSHKFKSASGQTGAMRLMKLLATLEKRARNSASITDMDEIFSHIQEEYRKVQDTLPPILEALLANDIP
jgi:signal transduction histidine kinase/CheY-like chemotaxis protein